MYAEESSGVYRRCPDTATLGMDKKMKNKAKKKIAILLICITITVLFLFYNYRNVIFQRGNPIPYVIAGMRISDETPYIEVFKNTGIYISQRGECPQLLDFVEESRNVVFVEQVGSGYVFTNGAEHLSVSSEIYLKYFTVWTVAQSTPQVSQA